VILLHRAAACCAWREEKKIAIERLDHLQHSQ